MRFYKLGTLFEEYLGKSGDLKLSDTNGIGLS